MLSALSIVCPPLAVLLTAPTSSAVKNVGLTLCGYVPGVLHARRAVEQYTVARQYDAVMTLLESREMQPLNAAQTQAA